LNSVEDNIIQRAIHTRDPYLAQSAFEEIDTQLQSVMDPPRRAELYFGKAVLCGVLHRFSDAREQLRHALNEAPNDPDVELQFDFISSSLLDEEGNKHEALLQLTSLLGKYAARLHEPDLRFMYEDIQQRRGFNLTRLQRFEEALPILKECVAFNLDRESRSDIRANLGLCYLELRNYQGAADEFQQAITTGLSESWKQSIHFYLGITYSQMGLLKDALKEFLTCEKLIAKRQIQSIQVYKWLSYVHRKLGNESESARYAALITRM